MNVIQYPTNNVKYFAINSVYVRADDTSVTKYCLDNGLTLSSYIAESKQRFSNDGAMPYQYYNGTSWVTEFGFSKIVSSLTVV